MAKIIFDVSEGKVNYSQRNNQYRYANNKATVNAATMCNVTSMCMALDYAGFHFPSGIYEQPEDNLANFLLNDKQVEDYYKAKMPAMYADFKNGRPGCYTPNEVHAVLAYGTNLWLGTDAVTFSTNVRIDDIKEEILTNRRPVVISGIFNGLHHIVCLVGLVYNVPDDIVDMPLSKRIGYIKDNNIEPVEIIVDDPWGNPLKDYKVGVTGNNVHLPYSFFISDIKPLNNDSCKWAHIISEPAAVV